MQAIVRVPELQGLLCSIYYKYLGRPNPQIVSQMESVIKVYGHCRIEHVVLSSTDIEALAAAMEVK
jgi:hypothetical protein